MIKFKITGETGINRNTSTEGETLETKVERIVENGEPINEGAPLIYTERKDGVKAEFDIRTDRFEIAIDAMDKVSRSQIAKRQGNIEEKNSNIEIIEDKTIQGTEE